MLGRNLLWVAKQHGHRTVTMLSTYAAWIDNAVDTDVDQIRRSMGLNRTDPGNVVKAGAQSARPFDASSGVSFRTRLRKVWQQFCQQRDLIKAEAVVFSHKLLCALAG